VIEDLLTAGAEAVADTAVGGMPIRRRMRRVRQEAERLLEPGEKLRLVVRAATGPSLVGFWILAGIMVGGILSTMFAPEGNDELLGLWFLFAALVFTVGIVVVRSLWRPVGVAVTDRRLLLTRNAWRTHRVKNVVLEISLAELSWRLSRSGQVLLLHVNDGAHRKPVRLVFLGTEHGGGAAVSEALRASRRGA
jgi:hypothetical protein